MAADSGNDGRSDDGDTLVPLDQGYHQDTTVAGNSCNLLPWRWSHAHFATNGESLAAFGAVQSSPQAIHHNRAEIEVIFRISQDQKAISALDKTLSVHVGTMRAFFSRLADGDEKREVAEEENVRKKAPIFELKSCLSACLFLVKSLIFLPSWCVACIYSTYI